MNAPICFSLTKSLSVPLKIPAPPEAKLAPFMYDAFFFSDKERYGGELGNPNFSAAKSTSRSNVTIHTYIYVKRYV